MGEDALRKGGVGAVSNDHSSLTASMNREEDEEVVLVVLVEEQPETSQPKSAVD